MRRLAVALAAVALVLPAAAVASTPLAVDTSGHPLVRITAVFASPSETAPTLMENGETVAGLTATNLGQAKSVVLAVDRSQSMRGRPLEAAVAAAQAFLAAKLPQDRIAVTTFATKPLLLANFSTSSTNAENALRRIDIDSVRGTTLYDGIVLSARALEAESLPGRVVIVVTDGNETLSEASLDEAIAAARKAGAAVYVVGIESSLFNPESLRELARETGGSYYGAASSEALTEVYSSIAEELTRTWRLEYFSSALQGETVDLVARLPGGEEVRGKLKVPGDAVVVRTSDKGGRLPEQFFGTVWGQALFALVVGLIVLVACAFALAAPKGAWLKGRLDPHVAKRRRVAERTRGDRFAMAAALFHATENALGEFKPWKRLHRKLERADLPLRTAEFVYVMLGAGLIAGLVAAALRPPVLFIGLSLVGGALLPYLFVSFKARRRLKAFENQLPDMLSTMAAGLKAGHSFRQALQSIADENQPPASRELNRVLTEARLGRSLEEALDEMAQRIGSKNFEFVITAVTIQRQVGGSLAGLFDMVADTVRNRQQFAKKIKGLTAMGRASAYVLIALPFFVASMLTLLNAEYMKPLWSTGTGHKLVIVTLVMMSIGSLILRKIVNFRY